MEVQKEDSASKEGHSKENEDVDILTIENVPVFQSDSEAEDEVFVFETAISRPTSGKGGADTPG